VRGVAQDSKAIDGAYFVAEFSTAFTDFGTFRKAPGDEKGWGIGDSDVELGGRLVEGTYAGAYLTFHTKTGERVLMKIAHGTSYAQAEQRLRDELPSWNFDSVHQAARNEWAKLLDRVQVWLVPGSFAWAVSIGSFEVSRWRLRGTRSGYGN
jgi:putative alpha-1,2-mannosidase